MTSLYESRIGKLLMHIMFELQVYTLFIPGSDHFLVIFLHGVAFNIIVSTNI